MPFETSTRLKVIQLATLAKPAGGGMVSWELPSTGILSHIHLSCTAAIVGGAVPNALGMASILQRVTLRLNSGNVLFDVSGAGYHWLVREYLDDGFQDKLAYTDARLAVAADASIPLDMIIPVSMNIRDTTGLLLLQNKSTLATLSVNFETDTNVNGAGAAVTASITPYLYVYELPQNNQDWPSFSTLHQIVEESQAIAAAGTFDAQIARGATLINQSYLTAGTTYTAFQLIAQQSNVLETHTPNSMRMRHAHLTGRDLNLAGTAITGFNNRILLDFCATDGLGSFGTVRDVLDTNALTSLFSRITAAGAGTLIGVRRQIVPLG